MSSDSSTPKDPPIHGINWQIGWLKTSVELGGALNTPSCQQVIEESLLSILNICDFYPEVATCTMQEDPIRRTITVTFSGQRKIPEKNGQQ